VGLKRLQIPPAAGNPFRRTNRRRGHGTPRGYRIRLGEALYPRAPPPSSTASGADRRRHANARTRGAEENCNSASPREAKASLLRIRTYMAPAASDHTSKEP